MSAAGVMPREQAYGVGEWFTPLRRADREEKRASGPRGSWSTSSACCALPLPPLQAALNQGWKPGNHISRTTHPSVLEAEYLPPLRSLYLVSRCRWTCRLRQTQGLVSHVPLLRQVSCRSRALALVPISSSFLPPCFSGAWLWLLS